jgi:hypothetical protein
MSEKNYLEESLQRMQAAIERSESRQRALEEWWARRAQPREDLREWKKRLRRARRERERSGGSLGAGVVYLAIASILAFRLVVEPQQWWLIWIVLGLGLAGVRRVVRYLEATRTQREDREEVEGTDAVHEKARPSENAAAGSKSDSELARVDDLCERLLAEIRQGPEMLRDVVRRPDEAVKGLKAGIHALAKREQELRALVTAEDDQRLQSERAVLVKKLEGEGDEVTRLRLAAALAALDEQLKQRADLVTAASRLEAERTRLRYTLESLYTQVLRVRSADSASAEVAGVGLRQSLQKLGDEISALAEALESVNRQEVEPSLPPIPPSQVAVPTTEGRDQRPVPTSSRQRG